MSRMFCHDGMTRNQVVEPPAIHHRNGPGFRIVSRGWQWPITANEARRRKSLKRGGDYRRQPIDDVLDRYENQNLDIMALDDALFELERLDQR